MSDSDSDHSEDGFQVDVKFLTTPRIGALIRSSDEMFERWCRISMEKKEEAGHLMKICAFWLPILLQQDESNTATAWALEIGIIDKSGDLSLKHLHKIEILETILRAMDKGSLKKDQAELVVWIANTFYLKHSAGILEDAVLWLERTEEPEICIRLKELGHINNCFKALHLIFIEFAQYINAMSTNIEKTIKALTSQPPDSFIEKSEDMKKKGNELFKKKQYEDAVEFYSKAAKYYPENHIIYGNRALSYIRCEQYLKAVVDGKRATLLKPRWAKGHYHYCEALFCLGEFRKALEANNSALSLCKKGCDGFKDLEQQHQKFLTNWTLTKGVSPTRRKKRDRDPCGCPKRSHHRKTDSAFKAEEKKETQYYSVKPPRSGKFMAGLVRGTTLQTKGSEVKTEKHTQPGKTDQTTHTKGSAQDSKTTKSGPTLTNGKAAHSTTPKKQKKETERKRSRQSEHETSEMVDSNAAICKQLRSVVEDAYTALDDHRSRNAEQAFSQALALLETSKSKDLGISSLDASLLLYGRARALTEIGRPEELTEAQKLLEKIKSFDERTFQCLVFFAVGRVYVKENRYTVALGHFSDSLQMVKNQITPGKLTWPFTKMTVKETQPEYLTNILENDIELCRFPPPPDAICRLENCVGSVKAEIFFTDPDFKGFFQIYCSESCVVEYHILCWKNLKTSSFDKTEKDFLQEACLTPDCVGRICCIKIFGPTGLVKCKFEAAIPKPQAPKKPRVNQKCTSLKKLKSKEDYKLRRKQYKQSFQDNKADSNEILLNTSNSTAQSQQKAWLLYRDRVLLQISQHMHLLREEKGLPVSALISSLRPWVELDHSRGNQLAGKILNWKEEPLETLGQVVEVLLERKNRVWARVLIHQLSSCLDINPKLSSWACHLNNAGLNAAQSFIEGQAEHLEQLDLALLLNFGPLQDTVIEKLDTRPEFFSSLGLTVTEYLKQALPHDMRLFIWTLEEHRDNYLSCHSILDEYFEMMDGHCSVLKKSEENQNSSSVKAKSRGRKKKQKEPKGVIVWPGMRSVALRDEWDQDFFEDDSLSFLSPSDPFSVPSHLREQVTSFEDQYNSSSHQNHYKNILDNNPDPTKESLYDYFAQILEEHGPLVAEDPLLVGELENFPAEAQQKIQEAGGFEPFLLGSLRFIKMERSIGLAKHAVVLQEADHGPSLDDLDDITDPDKYSQPSFTAYRDYPSVPNVAYPLLPNPYIYGFQCPPFVQSVTMGNDCGGNLTGNDLICHWTNSEGFTSGQRASYILANNSKELIVGVNETDCDALESEVSSGEMATKESYYNFLRKHAAIQTCQEAMRSVAVNTELHELFESYHGDISKKEKNNQELMEQIHMMTNDHEQLYLKRKDDIASLEADMQKTFTNIQVTRKELELFQHKLEEEVKKDQREKKANQEVLKSLKQEIEQLQQEHDSLARRIREKKTNYDKQLSAFLELSNQSAAEKMSLEDEVKRWKALVSTAVKRSHTAQMSVFECNQEQVLYSLSRELTDQRALLSKLDDVAPRHSTQDVEMARKTVRVAVQELEKQISSTKTLFQKQKDQVKNGTTVSELHPVNVTEPPEHPFSPPSEGASASHSTPVRIQPTVASAPAAEGHKPPIRTLEPPPTTVADKAIERLSPIFPTYTRSDLMKLIQKLRSSSGGSLYNMTLQDVVTGVTQLILDHQEQNSSSLNIRRTSSPAHSATPPLVNPAPVWQSVDTPRVPHSKALNAEDPCIICHEDMFPEDICVLECRHSFHNECIRSWLKEQSTCPTCRDHALLPEDFPVLPGRRRQAP